MKMWKTICIDFVKSLGVNPDEDLYGKIKAKTNIEIARAIRDEYFLDRSYDEIVYLFFEYIKAEYIKQDLKPNAIKLLEDMNKCGKVVLYSATALNIIDVLLDN